MLDQASTSVYSWLKIVSFSLTSMLGVIGILVDFKDKETGRLTKWGRINLFCLIVLFLIGVTSQVKEDRAKANEATAQRERDDAQKAQLKEIVTKEQSALSAAAEQQRALGEVISANGTLQTKTDKELDASRSLNREAERNLQPLAESIGVDYEFFHPLDEVEKQQLSYQIDSFKEQHPIRPTFEFQNKCSYKAEDSRFSAEGNVCGLALSPLSPIVKGTLGLNLLAHSPAFSIQIYDRKPFVAHTAAESIAHNRKGPDLLQPIAWFQYDPQQDTFARFDPDLHARPELMYTETASAVHIYSEGPVRFKQTILASDMVSVLDLGGKYIQIFNSYINRGHLCSLTLQFGPRFFKVPLSDAETDLSGNVVYRLPKDMKQKDADRQRAKAFESKCDYEGRTPEKSD